MPAKRRSTSPKHSTAKLGYEAKLWSLKPIVRPKREEGTNIEHRIEEWRRGQ